MPASIYVKKWGKKTYSKFTLLPVHTFGSKVHKVDNILFLQCYKYMALNQATTHKACLNKLHNSIIPWSCKTEMINLLYTPRQHIVCTLLQSVSYKCQDKTIQCMYMHWTQTQLCCIHIILLTESSLQIQIISIKSQIERPYSITHFSKIVSIYLAKHVQYGEVQILST